MVYISAAVALVHCCLFCSCTSVLEPDPPYFCIRAGLLLTLLEHLLSCIFTLLLPSAYLPDLVLPTPDYTYIIPCLSSMPASDHLLPT